MIQSELDKIIELHNKYLESGGKEGVVANFEADYLDKVYGKSNVSRKVCVYDNGATNIPTVNVDCSDDELYRSSHFEKLNFNGACLEGANFKGALFHNCDLSMVRFGDADLSQTWFVEVRNKVFVKIQANFSGAWFIGCDFSDSMIQEAKFDSAKIIRCKFQDSNIYYTHFLNSSIESSNFKGCTFWHVAYERCNMAHSVFNESEFKNCSIDHSNISNVDFSRSKLNDIVINFSTLCERLKQGTKPLKLSIGCNISNANCSEALKHKINENSYIDEFSENRPKSYFFWLLSSNCGRSGYILGFWASIIVVFFALIYWSLPNGAMNYPDHISDGVQQSFWTHLYYSVITFTTLGYGDISPSSILAMALAGGEVIIGFIFLGLLINLFSNKLAPR
ncbi:hypothetical protein CWC29_014530 [Pseudoalteromonas sp. S4498]|uniref:pentapeptide repeat-containing protein n=1 Tax=Pseudoalteromonas galatheae TaxID=579562 RepID=UPI001109FAA3|nr:pentapeptide repeat-containing protein [Pseudoalteromonas galatheae]NKC20029.1 hypothetical protein [Pseudoalteromonas galatheae]